LRQRRHHLPFLDQPVDRPAALATGGRTVQRTRRRLATVLFTDLVGSTERASSMGDHAWRDLLERHESLLHQHVADAGGRVVKMIGDGSLSVFDGPARAIGCASEFAEAARRLNLDVRAGLHSGECELLDEDIAGIAVHIGARVSALAGAGEVFVSRTVKDLVVGSGLEFAPRGTHELKGVPGSWELFALADARSPTVPVAAEQPSVRSSDRIVLAAARRAPGLLRLAGRFARS
jgi:class 3 adenylate cyclase